MSYNIFVHRHVIPCKNTSLISINYLSHSIFVLRHVIGCESRQIFQYFTCATAFSLYDTQSATKQDKYFNILRVLQRFRSTTRNQQRNKTKQTIFSRNCKQTTSAIAKQTTSTPTKKLAKSTMVNLTSFTLFIFLSQLLVKLSACYPLDMHCKISYF